MPARPETFVVARNPQQDSHLPYLVRLPLDGGLVLKVRDTWPRAARVYCHPFEEPWPDEAEVVDEAPVTVCRRRGAAIDLVLARPSLSRSQFVFTEVKGRPAIFWQTQVAARQANPGARVPKARSVETVAVRIDTRERYPYKFAGLPAEVERLALPAGDYGAVVDGQLVAAVERKALDNFTASLADGTLAFQVQKLSEVASGAVVVESNYADLFRSEHVSGAWLADMLVRLQLRYPEVPIVFAGSRRLAEDWTFRFLRSASEDVSR
ncbi:MAG TPA: ERCC4 domain-containing protein [Actinomycetota bacterium]|nr:ERCC4 domain-containing protein [Actinomycetota bacterium]